MRNAKRSFKREKRFLLLMPEYMMGGAETQFRYLINYAEKKNWKLDAIIEHRFREDDSLLKKDAAQMTSVRLYEVDRCRDGSDRLFQAVIICILRHLLLVQYSACLIYNPADLVFAPIMRIFGIRVIYSERIDGCYIAGNQYYQKCLKSCSHILANSEYAQNELKKLTGRKVGLIRNGKPIVQPFPVKENREIRRILVPGRIIARKNQMLLLYYLRDYPGFEGKIVFAGNMEDKSYQGKMRSFINRNHLQERVIFLGHVEEMSKEYEAADLVVLPSYSEGTPNVVLEAYAYGRPVIVSDIAMEREVVQDPDLRFGLKNT